MFHRLFKSMTVALLSGVLLFPSLRASESNSTTSARLHTEDLQPFTHFAYIPAGADLSTIRFEKAILGKVPSRILYTTDAGYCTGLAFRDPGGSIACPGARTEATVPAYEVTYSLTGEPLASDEYAGRNFTFSVYFRLNELAPDVQKALSGRKLSRSDAAAYFTVSTFRAAARRVAIDDKQSHFCEGNYADGMWTHTDAGCKDTISYTPVTAPSDYISVKVDPASSRVQKAEMVSAK
jgi:hypothetical protein